MNETSYRRTRRPIAGVMLMVIGVAHLLVGVIGFGDTFAAMAADGLVGSLGDGRDATERETAFWFEVTGLVLVLLAGLIIWVERHAGVPPLGLAIGLAALAVAGGAVAPASPFWTFLAPAAVIAWRHARQRTGKSPAYGVREGTRA